MDTGLPLGEALVACLNDSRTDWYRKYEAGRGRDVAWTNDVIATHLDTQLKHGGQITVVCTVLCRFYGRDITHIFHLQRRTKDAYIRTGSTLDKR